MDRPDPFKIRQANLLLKVVRSLGEKICCFLKDIARHVFFRIEKTKFLQSYEYYNFEAYFSKNTNSFFNFLDFGKIYRYCTSIIRNTFCDFYADQIILVATTIFVVEKLNF